MSNENEIFKQDFNEVAQELDINDTYDEHYLKVFEYVRKIFEPTLIESKDKADGLYEANLFMVKYWAIRLYLLTKDSSDDFELIFDDIQEPGEIIIKIRPDYGS